MSLATFNKFCNKQACTCWFDGFKAKDWSQCCKEHDNDIIEARTKSSFAADIKLFKCVWKVCRPIAVVMFVGVLPLSWMAWRYYRKKEQK